MKSQIVIALILTFLAVSMLYGLKTVNDSPNSKKNGFTRKRINDWHVLGRELKVPNDVKDICYIGNDTIYLQSRRPELIYLVVSFTKVDTIRLDLPVHLRKLQSFTSSIDYPFVYIISERERKIISYNLQNKNVKITGLSIPGPIIKSVYLSEGNFVGICIDTTSNNTLFYKANVLNGKIDLQNNIIEGLGDGGMVHQGSLTYDNTEEKIGFVEYYSNNIAIISTALKIENRYHTIDTTNLSTMHIRISPSGITSRVPPILINGLTASINGAIYVRSYLKADNDKNNDGKIPIDQYDIRSGEYAGTSYIHAAGRGLSDFLLNENLMYVLYNDYSLSKLAHDKR